MSAATQPQPERLVERVLRALARAVYRHPRLFFYPQAVLFLACLLFTVLRLEFHTSRDALVGADKLYHQNFLRFKAEFPVQDDMVVVVESEDLEKNRQFVERLGARLEAETNLFANVFYKGDLKMLGRKALLFIPEEELQELKRTLEQSQAVIQHFARATNFIRLFELVNTQMRTAKRETNAENAALLNALPVLERLLQQGIESLRRQGMPVSPGLNALFGSHEEAEQRLYITFNQGRIYLVTARPQNEALGPEALGRLRQLMAEVQHEVPGVNVGLTGELVLELDEMEQAQRDTTWATVISLLVCAVIFIYAYRETGRPLKATACLMVGVVYTLGYTTLAVGHLNLLTITFVPILIGLGIDFGVHLISRYEEEVRHGRSELEALEIAMVHTGTGIFTGCFTTAGAFWAIALTDFKGIQEMGVICGGGLLICLVPMMTLLPVLLLRGRQNVLDHAMAGKSNPRQRLEQFWLGRPAVTLAVAGVLSGLAATQLPKIRFDYNLLHMQSAGLPAVEYEMKLIHSAGKSVLFCALVATNLEHALELEARARQLPSVASVDSMAPYLSSQSTNKLGLVGEIKRLLEPVHFLPPDPAPVNLDELSQVLWSFSGYLGLALEELGNREPELRARLESLRQTVLEFRREMLRGDRVQTAAKLAAYQRAFFQDVVDTFENIRHQDHSAGLQVDDLPPALRQRFVGRTGKFLVMVYPRKDVWERAPQEEFVRQLRSVDPNVTGTPVQLYEYVTLLLESYLQAARYALAAIALLVLIHFRSLTAVALGLLPVGLGTLWMVGIMGWRDILFNPANIMTLPLVIGIGVTNGIHVLNRFMEEHDASVFSRSTGKAVLVSGLTTVAGFASLIPAKHQGIASLGFVMSVGVATCMVVGLVVLPALLLVMQRRGMGRWLIKKPSIVHAPSDTGPGGTEVKPSTRI
ncbi:MAG: MMPL family transporter [Verrucomicrobiae bacterium]|nr:MMPL family transporter [Verrucomicrobiae bacterium]